MKVGIVEPGASLAHALRTAISSDVADEVLWTVGDEGDAIRSVQRSPPDVILIGVRALKNASASFVSTLKRPVVVVTTAADRDVSTVYAAMSSGASIAADFPFPAADPIALQTFLRQAHRVSPRAAAPLAPAPSATPPLSFFVALGASTGGPVALCEVLRGIGPNLPAPIVIVQHIEPTYIQSLGEQLARDGGIPVDLSSRTLSALPGRVLLAATSEHLVLHADGRSVRFVHQPPLTSDIHHPSVEALFSSLALAPHAGVAALLTGMGRDGATGLLSLRRAGWHTIAQDEKSSVVHGMPKAAADLGAARVVLPLSEIGGEIRAETRRRWAARGADRG